MSPPGGLLADEMGLGKTVEVLSCMLMHPRGKLPPVEPLPIIEEEQPKVRLRIHTLVGFQCKRVGQWVSSFLTLSFYALWAFI